MEKIPVTVNSLYPERPSSNIAVKVENLEKFVSGEVPVWEIPEAERAEILEIEAGLAKVLEDVVAIKTKSVSFNFNYLLSVEGGNDFEAVVGVKIPPEAQDFDSLKNFLYTQTSVLNGSNYKKILDLAGRSVSYREDEIYQSITSSMSEDGNVDTSNIPSSDSVNIRLTPELDYGKSTLLRQLKADIKQQREQLASSDQGETYKAFLDGIFDLYQRKVNEMIAESSTVFLSLAKKADFVGEESLTEDEKKAYDEDTIGSNVSANLSRYDKFLFGADTDYADDGWKKQISAELIEYADEQERKIIAESQEKSAGIAEKGLDEDKLFALTIEPAEIGSLCEEALAHYDLLSAVPPSEYVANRPGPAEDNKWQVIVSDSFKSLSVNGTQKVIKCPNKPQSVDKLISVSIGHEIEGHAIQHNNLSKIPLKLFEKVGTDRSSIFAEAGAMSNQDYVTKSAFGYSSSPHPNYIRAMATKLEGRDYSDCLKAFYESATNPHQAQLEGGLIDQEKFKKLCEKDLKIAINRTGRLFRGGMSRSDTSGFIAESKATVYVEQTKLAAELKERGLEKFLYLTRVNFSSIEFLLRAGLINLDDIQTPDFYCLKIWDRIKSRYEKEPVAD